MSSRRAEQGAWDHGAQYFKVRSPHFERHVAAWLRQGVVSEWTAPIHVVRPGSPARASRSQARRFVGSPRMSALTRHLSTDLKVRSGVRVAAVERESDQWCLRDADGASIGTWDRVVLATPSPQASDLLPDACDAFRTHLSKVQIDPCWALLVEYDAPWDGPFDAAMVEDSPLSWVAREPSKPGRTKGERWIAHASPAWSQAHLEREAEWVEAQLVEALREVLGDGGSSPTHHKAHRWRYALVTEPLGLDCLYDVERGVGLCGDWCLGGRVEAAWQSGVAMAGRLLGEGTDSPSPSGAV